MSIDYTIAAIPTEYKGRRYRSRLEARWAAFFDLLGFRAEYEPIDLGSWSPDFQLSLSPAIRRHTQMLVEIKPTAFPDRRNAEILTKASRAVEERGLTETTVVALFTQSPYVNGYFVGIGGASWWNDVNRNGRVVVLVWLPQVSQPGMYPDLALLSTDFFNSPPKEVLGLLSGKMVPYGQVHWYSDYTMEIWARASNAVQWLGKRA